VDTRSNITPQNRNLEKTRKSHPKSRDKVKSVSGSIIEKLGKVQAIMYDESLKILLHFSWLSTGELSVRYDTTERHFNSLGREDL